MATDGNAAAWVLAKHPQHQQILADQDRQRASYISTRRELVQFLVPHRFEGSETEPDQLIRSQYGYGIGLNKSYLQDIIGHIRGAPALWQWGAMEEAGGEATPPSPLPPSGGLAKAVWEDATRDNVTWLNFFFRKVLEWVLSSPGGFVLVDNPQTDGQTMTIEEAKAAATRPYVSFWPWGRVEDWGRFELGFQYIKIVTSEENRDPKADPTATDKRVRVLYELDTDSGVTTVSRWDASGQQIGSSVDLGKLVDRQGTMTLPFIPAVYGEREGLDYVGEGLIADLADIIIDMFNVYSETREGFRDAAFGIITYAGDRGTKIQELMEQGTRFVDLGENDNAAMDRLAGTTEEVVQGLGLMEFCVRAWETAARNNAANAQTRATTMSGVALQAEFQLDLAPLLREVASTLDQIESDTMFMVGQFGSFDANQLQDVGVIRSTEFRPEEEAGRITRLMKDFAQAGIPVPAAVQVAAFMAWAKNIDFLDLEAEVTLADGTPGILKDLLEAQVTVAIDEDAVLKRNEAAFLLGAQPAADVVVETPEGDLEPL